MPWAFHNIGCTILPCEHESYSAGGQISEEWTLAHHCWHRITRSKMVDSDPYHLSFVGRQAVLLVTYIIKERSSFSTGRSVLIFDLSACFGMAVLMMLPPWVVTIIILNIFLCAIVLWWLSQWKMRPNRVRTNMSVLFLLWWYYTRLLLD